MIRLHSGDQCVLIRQSKSGASGEPVECVRAWTGHAVVADIGGKMIEIDDKWFRKTRASLYIQLSIDKPRGS